jgi:hypothetical protein
MTHSRSVAFSKVGENLYRYSSSGVYYARYRNKGKEIQYSLGIRSLQIAAPFEGGSLVYRTGEFSYERDPYAEFLESPDQELIAPLREGLLKGSGFSAVVDAGSMLKPAILVEISVSQFFGDLRQPEHPAAVMAVQFVFFDATNGLPGKIIFLKEYSCNIPLDEPTAAGLMAGWNEALTEILAEVSSDPPTHRNRKTRR